jgi:predicted metal-dependent HD superfamily phosphohydrolase
MSISPPPYSYQILRNEWQAKCASFCSNEVLINKAFDKLEMAYADTSRHYHNLTHIENMLGLLEKYKQEITEPEILYFAIWYHDAVYKTLKKNSEEKSAVLAVKELTALGMNSETVNRISEYICATKAHAATQDKNLQWLLDFDLSILGAESKSYMAYTEAVRKEYSIYPDFMYKPGRKKAMQHFLEKEHIFQTEQFRILFEERARLNISAEISGL